jgi:uncharacterized membrane protein
MIGLIVGLVLFLGIHMVRVVAPEFRNRFISERGEGAWKGIYSLASLLGFVLIVWFYSQAAATGPVLYEPPVWMKHVNALLMLFASIAMGVYLFPVGRLKVLLKHPMLLSVKIWALGHLLANGSLAAILLFGSFLAWAVIVRISLKKRVPANGEAKPVATNVAWDAASIVAGLAIYLVFMAGLHLWLFGVSPIALS